LDDRFQLFDLLLLPDSVTFLSLNEFEKDHLTKCRSFVSYALLGLTFCSSSLNDAKAFAVFTSCGLMPASLATFDFRIVIVALTPLPSSALFPTTELNALASA
jgi:hypothetical protein